MLNRKVKDLTEALSRIRLNQEEIIRALDSTNQRESVLLQNLVTAQTAADSTIVTTTEAIVDTNPYVIGNQLVIKNDIRD